MQGLSVISPTPASLLKIESECAGGGLALRKSRRSAAIVVTEAGNPKPSAIFLFTAGWLGVERRDVRVRARHGCRLGMPLTPCVREGYGIQLMESIRGGALGDMGRDGVLRALRGRVPSALLLYASSVSGST